MVLLKFWKKLKKTPQRSVLYQAAFYGSLLGFVVPPASLISKLAANNAEYLYKATNKIGLDFELFEWIKYFPSWHFGDDIQLGHVYYIRWSIYGFLSLVILFIWGNKIDDILIRIKNKIPNNLVLFFSIFLIFTYQSKLFSGWWFSGIGGWDYRNRSSKIEEKISNEIKDYTYLNESVNHENARKLYNVKGDYCLPGEAYIATNEDNQKYPINLGVLEIVFPHRFLDEEITLKLLNYKMNLLHVYNKYYPEHAPYMEIDFEKMSNKNLISLEHFDILLCTTENKTWIGNFSLEKTYE